MSLIFLTLIALQAGADGVTPKQGNTGIDLQSDTIGVLGVPLAESKQPIFRISLKGKVQANGTGDGVLTLDPAGPIGLDDFGFAQTPVFLPAVTLDCRLKFVKSLSKTYHSRRLGAEETTVFTEEWRLYSITGPKIKSPLFLALRENDASTYGRIVIHGAEGKPKYSIDLRMPPQPEPCHPGCFPAGTRIATPGGDLAIEKLQEGDTVTTILADGSAAKSKVKFVFMTQNHLIEIKTAAGTLLTTVTQPLSLADGQLKPAGELKAGERIKRWNGKEKSNTQVLGIVPTGRHVQVFNLILGEPVLFVANGYLARSKPPAVVRDPNVPVP